ncbi:MAG: rRNA pseudouridine synthase [Rhodanobacter sp.]|jgi:23S rRNA pseudouridine2605 synthase|nr:rRNA pseudouridine synthase [Rhodanobacter sp.]
MTIIPRSILTLKRSGTTTADSPPLEERLHKVLANAGLGSRRMLETRIEAHEVKLNGAAATLGQSVRIGDRVEMDGKRFVVVADDAEHAQVLLYNKPEGVIATREDPEGRPTVFENLPQIKGARWVAVGRLDINTTGLLLLTNDGDLANALMHPRAEIEREYICRVHGEVPDETIERLRSGVELDDGPAHFDEIAIISRGASHSWFRVVLCEGRNREVRRMWESQGVLVSRLKRIRYGSVELPRGLRPGACTELDAAQIAILRERADRQEIPARLTLAPVIGQRRAPPTAYHPDSKTPQAWTGGALHDEAREFAAFDRLNDDGWRAGNGKPPSRKQRKKQRPARDGAAAPSNGAGRRRGAPAQNRGNQARPQQGRGQGRGQRADASQHQGSAYQEQGLSPAVLRSWFPETAGRPGRKRRGARPGEALQGPFHTPSSLDDAWLGNSTHPQNRPRRPLRGSGNTAPQHSHPQGGTPGNSLYDGPRNSRPGGNKHRRGPRPPR